MSDGNLLQRFWSLSSLSDEERIQAARELIISLSTHQAEHDGQGLCAELEYSLKRLVRGLASNRKAARHGYFITLTELLVQFPQVQLSDVYQLIHTHLESTGGIKGHEERGIYFGRVFALLALLRSGRLNTSEDVLNVVKQICSCAQKKTFLQELCMVTVGQLISEDNFSDDVVRDHVIPLVGVTSGWDECTPERLYIVLLLSKLFGKEKWFKEILKTKWNSKNVCSHANFSKLASTLLGSSSSHPRLHSVWPLVLETIRGKGHFGEFWKTAVDDSLFTSSHERKYVGFQLLETLLPSLSVGEVPLVFSPNLLRCLVNNASSQENYLHPAAKHLLTELTSFLQSNVNQSLNITMMLHIQRRTGGKFDQLTGSKVMETILARLDEDGVNLLVAQLQQMFCDPVSAVTSEDSDEEGCGDAHSVQLWVLEQLLAVVRNPRLPRADSWLLSIARFLFLHTYFNATSQLEQLARFKVQAVRVPLEQVVVDSCSQKLTSVLSDLSGLLLRQQPLLLPAEDQRGGGGRFGPPGVMKGGQFFLTELLKFTKEVLSQTDDRVEHRQPFEDESVQAWTTACEAMESLSTKEELSSEEKAFLLLYSSLGLQLLSPSEREGTAHSIEELKVCYSEMELAVGKKGRTPKKKRQKTAEESATAAPSWIEVLTDMLLGFLSQPSQLWRNVTEQVFKLVSGHVTLDSLQLILGVLEPKSTKEELMENEEEEEGEASSEDNGDSSEGEGSEMDKDERGSLVSEDGGSEDEAGEEGEVDPVFRAEVQKALGAAAVDSDVESESSLDDDAMMAVDDALAAVFRTRFALKHHRKQKKDEAKSILHFKLRVLDLVELYIRKESTNPLVLDLVVPLYALIHAAQSQKESSPLVKRASGIFKNRLCHPKEYPKVDFDVNHVHYHLQQMVQYLYKVNPLMVPLVTQGCMFLLRVLRGSTAPPTISPLTTRAGKKRKKEEAEKETGGIVRGEGVLNVKLVNGWMRDALHDFITRKNSNVPPSFFTTYIERYPTLASQLAPVMVEDLPSAANHFKKTQVIEMLIMLNGMDLLGSEVVDKLTNEDAEVVLSASTKSKKRKRSKHKKQNRSVLILS